MTLFDGIFLLYVTIILLIVVFMFKQNTQAQGVILKTYKEISELIGNFRQEMERRIKDALAQHVKEFHKS